MIEKDTAESNSYLLDKTSGSFIINWADLSRRTKKPVGVVHKLFFFTNASTEAAADPQLDTLQKLRNQSILLIYTIQSSSFHSSFFYRITFTYWVTSINTIMFGLSYIDQTHIKMVYNKNFSSLFSRKTAKVLSENPTVSTHSHPHWTST